LKKNPKKGAFIQRGRLMEALR